MRKFFGAVSMALFLSILLTACQQQHIEKKPTDENPITDVGAFNNTVISKDGYEINISSEEVGNPSPDYDFAVSFDWQAFENSSTNVLVWFNVISGRMETDYPDIDKSDTLRVDDKDMFCKRYGRDDLKLLYEISEELYMTIELKQTDSFDSKTGKQISINSDIGNIFEDKNFNKLFHIMIKKNN